MMSRDISDIINCLKHTMANTYSSEHDLLITSATLDMLARTDDFSLSLGIRKAFNLKATPILNFLDMLYEVIQIKDFGLLKDLIAKYDKELQRDPGLMAVSN